MATRHWATSLLPSFPQSTLSSPFISPHKQEKGCWWTKHLGVNQLLLSLTISYWNWKFKAFKTLFLFGMGTTSWWQMGKYGQILTHSNDANKWRWRRLHTSLKLDDWFPLHVTNKFRITIYGLRQGSKCWILPLQYIYDIILHIILKKDDVWGWERYTVMGIVIFNIHQILLV